MERPLKLPESQHDPLLVVILGPTASGKTELSLNVARRFKGEIINCDSIAMYREFEIGTAKPSTSERAEIPHHLVDCNDPLDDVTAGDYARIARKVLHAIGLRNTSQHETSQVGSGRSILPIITGGTGLYLRALLEGLFNGPQRSEALRDKLRTRTEKLGAGHLHRVLQRVDAAAASRIHENDLPKIIRAIEVCLATRRPMTQLWQQGREPLVGFRILRLGLNPDREALYERINRRAAEMLKQGLVPETERLLEKYGERARPLQSLGYKQAMQFLRGELDREQLLAAAQQAHRNYAKRQITWFRREPDVHWLNGFGDDPSIQAQAIATIATEI